MSVFKVTLNLVKLLFNLFSVIFNSAALVKCKKKLSDSLKKCYCIINCNSLSCSSMQMKAMQHV